MHLFPYIFGRSGGGAINELEALKNSKKLQEAITCMLKAEEKLNQIGQKMVHLLYFLFSSLGHPVKNRIILPIQSAPLIL